MGSIDIVPYDPKWSTRFEAERRIILEAFHGVPTHVEHVGSTAVPGLGAKPIVDIMLGVRHLSEIEARISDLITRGYAYVPDHEILFPERRFFVKPPEPPRRFHLHAVEQSSDSGNDTSCSGSSFAGTRT